MLGVDLFKPKDAAPATTSNTWNANTLTMEQPTSPPAPSSQQIVSEQPVPPSLPSYMLPAVYEYVY
jgi:hypothetical protein